MHTESDMRKLLYVCAAGLVCVILSVNGCQPSPNPTPVVTPPGTAAPIDQAWAQYKADQIALFQAAKANSANLADPNAFFNYINGSLTATPASGTVGNLAKDFGPAGAAIGQAFTASGPAAACDMGVQIWSGGAIPAASQPIQPPQPQMKKGK